MLSKRNDILSCSFRVLKMGYSKIILLNTFSLYTNKNHIKVVTRTHWNTSNDKVDTTLLAMLAKFWMKHN